MHKKIEINNEKDNLINQFFYNNGANAKNKDLNKKITLNNKEIKRRTINLECSTKIMSKKYSNLNTYMRNNNTIDFNLENKKEIDIKKNKKSNNNNTNNSNKINVLKQKKMNNTKKMTNIDSKIIFNIRKNKTINDYDKKAQNSKNNNKLIISKHFKDDNKNGNNQKNNKNQYNKKNIC